MTPNEVAEFLCSLQAFLGVWPGKSLETIKALQICNPELLDYDDRLKGIAVQKITALLSDAEWTEEQEDRRYFLIQKNTDGTINKEELDELSELSELREKAKT